jgi:hypothetical protein
MVTFAEIALVGLKNVTENEEMARALQSSIALHLRNDGALKSVELQLPGGKLLFLFAMMHWRILWELEGPEADDIMVWSVSFRRMHGS